VVKIFVDHLYERISINPEFMAAYAVDRGEGLPRYGLDHGHVPQGLIPENDKGRNALFLGQFRPFPPKQLKQFLAYFRPFFFLFLPAPSGNFFLFRRHQRPPRPP